MQSPFPGMDPYLERRWSDVHVKLIGFIGEALQEHLPPALRARSEEEILVEERDGPESDARRSYRADVVVVAKTDPQRPAAGGAALMDRLIVDLTDTDPVADRWVQIIDVTSGNKVVTAIEVLSPSNKAAGRTNRRYRKKLADFAAAGVSVVEIDLIRATRRRLTVTREHLPADYHTPYLCCVRRGWTRRQRWEVCPIPLRERIPPIPVPLRQSDDDAVLELQPLIDRIYRAGGHDDIDYSVDPVPPLSPDDAAWADALLRRAGRRG